MGSCCRRNGRPGPTSPQSFCASLSMATPVLLRQTATGVPEVTVTVGSERVSLPEVLARFSCSGIPTVGVRLADVVARSLKTAWRKDPAGVSKILGSSMPLLTAKDKIYAMLEKCDFCKGIGCHVCGNLGFKQ